MRHALIVLQQLSVFDDPDWSTVYVRDTLDFFWVLDQLVQKIEEATAELNFDENHPFCLAGKKIAIAKAYCAERMGVHPSGAHPGGTHPGTAEYRDSNCIDDTWFQDIFGLFDHQYDVGAFQM